MNHEQLEQFDMWFRRYVAGFYGDDAYINAHTKMKEDHTRRTCDETAFLAEQLGLDANQKLIAQTVALFHDVGRFPQFARYRTYNDAKSVDHSLLGVEVLREQNILSNLDEQERQWIETAIRYHGRRQIPDGLNEQELLFTKLIRDADKLDVLYLVTDRYAKTKDEPERAAIADELPTDSRYSQQVVQAILAGQLVGYESVRTLSDMRLCQLGWVYDVNFTATLARIRQRGFLEKLLAALPQTDDIGRVRNKILDHVEKKLRQETSSDCRCD
jgi:HD superfamily phosphodiesterase